MRGSERSGRQRASSVSDRPQARIGGDSYANAVNLALVGLPPWVTALISLLVGLTAIAVLVADDADTTWALSTGTAGLLGALAGGVAGWQAPSPHDPKEAEALKKRVAELEAWQKSQVG